MSKSIKVLAWLGLAGLLAACGDNTVDDGASGEFIVIQPVTVEPTFTGKL
ncbi:MAG: hypothetical protein AAGI10_11605 [Pseudomonadota bacterium]